MTSILIMDNYDSFVHNIAQYLGEMGAEVQVERNDSLAARKRLGSMDGYVISPGPGHPRDTNLSLRLLEEEGYGAPVLGVCLGHQAIAHVLGGRIQRAKEVVHGKVDSILHRGAGLLEGIPSPLRATRYHSLIVSEDDLPASLEVTARDSRQQIMGLRVRGLDIFGLQFHPESVMTSDGKAILANFLGRCGN
ncbi:MAG: anthranilate synthase component II [Methanomassiliicoccales archaeon]